MSLIVAVLSYISRLVFRLRYRITVTGDPIRSSKRGTLLVANHPALIDPCILTAYLWPTTRFHPLAADFLEQSPLIGWILSWYKAIYVPVFDDITNSYKKFRIEQSYAKVFECLKAGECVLLYPAGGLKNSGQEVLGGASGLHRILQEMPNVDVYFIRTQGLWGSQFSKAITGKAPNIISSFLRGLKIIFKNGLLFTPRRKVTIECVKAPSDFPRQGKKREINAYLEKWFNEKGPEPLTLVSYSCFRIVLPTIYKKPEQQAVDYDSVSQDTIHLIFSEISQLASTPIDNIRYDHDLALDLGLDSLDKSQLTLLLKESFGILGVLGSQLTTVGSVLGYASKQIVVKEQEEYEVELKTPEWEDIDGRPLTQYPNAATLIEGFLQTCDRMSDWVAAVDPNLGEITYKRLKLGILVFANYLKQMPDERIGVLLPSSIAANMVVFAILLAGKVPVMINWTLGGRNLKAIVELTQIKTTISSWKFLDQLDNTDLDGLDHQILTLESIKQRLNLKAKAHAFLLSFRRSHSLAKYFSLDRMTGEEVAVVLFTSGTESTPKGVPLTHRNIMANQRAAHTMFEIKQEDALLSCLPPFHSFGFSVTGLFPLLMGWRVAYMPNPTQGRRLASAIKRWKLTAVCSVPTFLKMLLRASSSQDLQTLRLLISGAEPCPKQLVDAIKERLSTVEILEGYGVTECAPILTLTPPGLPHVGVGVPLPGISLKVVNPETHEPMPQKKEGLILASGPNVFKGYLNGQSHTPFIEIDSQKWYNTGDLGVLDDGGNLILSGRLKRFVKIGGEMVSMEAVEHVLNASAKNEQWPAADDAPILAVCAVEEQEAKPELHLVTTFPVDKNRINELLKENGMSNLIRITGVHQVPRIPLLGTGKIHYRQLTQMLGPTNNNKAKNQDEKQ